MPYTRENIMLSFKPHAFFNELEKISNYKRRSLENAFRQAERQKLIIRQTEHRNNIIKLTDKGEKIIRPFIAEKLADDAKLMVIFDIPEAMATHRAQFRRILQSWHFKQIQKSVWVTTYDHRQSVKEIVDELDLAKYVQLYECAAVH